MSDQYVTMYKAPIDEIISEEDNLSFKAYAYPINEKFLIEFIMTIKRDSMEGKIEIPALYMTGKWEASKRKNCPVSPILAQYLC